MVLNTSCSDREGKYQVTYFAPQPTSACNLLPLSSSPVVYANANRLGGSVGGVFRGPAPAPLAPPPAGLLGLWPEGFLSPCVHVTVLGWNVNNKEECPSIQRVPEGREFGCTRPSPEA